jgi:23S rRNA pseudouridine955/2504/2580 synthase
MNNPYYSFSSGMCSTLDILHYISIFPYLVARMTASELSANQSPKSSILKLEVSEHQDQQRLDNFLINFLKGVPKTLIYRIIRKGEVRVNGKRAKPEHKLQVQDIIRVPPLRLPTPEDKGKPGEQLQNLLQESVLFEDDQILVVNKLSGLAVHGGTGVKLGLIEALRAIRPDLPALELVHRLDKGTSGCIVLAKSGKARKGLTEAFRAREVVKIYHALVVGKWPKEVTMVDANLNRQAERGGERRVEISAEGKEARTQFKIIKQFANATLVQAQPVTGRTHQIRVHAAWVGCPLVGDDKYNTANSNTVFARVGIKRLCLHAAEVRFPHPQTGQQQIVTAAYDTAFTQALSLLAVKG